MDPLFVPAARAAEILGVDLSTLNRWSSGAPSTLPGAPVGEGERRRWEVAVLPVWAAAAAAWERGLRLPAPDQPVTTWKAVAQVVGVSEDTLARRRKERRDPLRRAWFPSPDHVRSWWSELLRPPAPRRCGRRGG